MIDGSSDGEPLIKRGLANMEYTYSKRIISWGGMTITRGGEGQVNRSVVEGDKSLRISQVVITIH